KHSSTTLQTYSKQTRIKPHFIAFNGLSSHQPKTAIEKARSRSRQWLRYSERSSGVLRDNFFPRTLARLWCQLCVILFCCCFRPNSKLYTRVRTVLGWTPGREVPSDVLRTEARRN